MLKCPFCSHTTKREGDLKIHIWTHAGEDKSPCPHCGERISAHHLKDHIKNVHFSTINIANTFQCPQGDKTFKCSSSFKLHRKAAHGTSNRFQSKLGSYSTGRKSSLGSHLRIHTGEKPYRCDQCPYSAAQISNLNTDIKMCHSDLSGETFKCQRCSRTLKTAAQLKQHKRNHTAEKTYKCEECPNAARNASSLSRHQQQVHESVKAHKCSFCSRAFSTSDDLTRHLLNHTGEKPHKCRFCDFAARFASGLRVHLRSHTGERPYKCEVCAFRSSFSSSLKRHARTHTEERPYECSICSATFRSMQNLHGHNRKHTGERPFKCRFCDFTTIWSSNFSSHEKSHGRDSDEHTKLQLMGRQNKLKEPHSGHNLVNTTGLTKTKYVCKKNSCFAFQDDKSLAMH